MTDDKHRDDVDCRDAYFEEMRKASEINQLGLSAMRYRDEKEGKG